MTTVQLRGSVLSRLRECLETLCDCVVLAGPQSSVALHCNVHVATCGVLALFEGRAEGVASRWT